MYDFFFFNDLFFFFISRGIVYIVRGLARALGVAENRPVWMYRLESGLALGHDTYRSNDKGEAVARTFLADSPFPHGVLSPTVFPGSPARRRWPVPRTKNSWSIRGTEKDVADLSRSLENFTRFFLTKSRNLVDCTLR